MLFFYSRGLKHELDENLTRSRCGLWTTAHVVASIRAIDYYYWWSRIHPKLYIAVWEGKSRVDRKKCKVSSKFCVSVCKSPKSDENTFRSAAMRFVATLSRLLVCPGWQFV